MSEELKPCPFCGGKDLEKEVIDGIEGMIYRVSCPHCANTMPMTVDTSMEEAIRIWNTRPIEYGLEVENECLRKTLCEIRKALCEIMELRNLNNNLKYTNTPSCAEDIFANFYCIMGDIAIKALNKVYKEN